jgi:hypothetical protein
MKKIFALTLACCALVMLAAASNAAKELDAVVHHKLRVALMPALKTLQVVDTITLAHPLGAEGLRFVLHEGLSPEVDTPGIRLTPEAPKPDGQNGQSDQDASGYSTAYRLTAATPTDAIDTVTLRYGGVLSHPLAPVGKEYARGFMSTPGIISEKGVVLSGASLWLPRFGDELITFELDVSVPKGWDAVSQGTLTPIEHFTKRVKKAKRPRSTKNTQRAESRPDNRVRWVSARPQDEAYLIAAPFTRYEQSEGSVTAQAYLRTPDDTLAAKYLEATLQYVKMYEQLIGPYPFTKFALVENFWETGFGMPSFTLLGPRIIRFPFILRTSYPHEVLHNWWGNSVYVDYATGNWAEGLTAYLADHLMRENSGAGADHRESTLQKYTDYVAGLKQDSELVQDDFFSDFDFDSDSGSANEGDAGLAEPQHKPSADKPLSQFRSRHSSASEAIGYGKALMLFHMLRLELGDDAFVAGLKKFYADNRWRRAGWTDLRAAFEAVSGTKLSWFFAQWVERTGAPTLELKNLSVESAGDKWVVKGTVEQVQEGAPYRLGVRVALTLEGEEEAVDYLVPLGGDTTATDFEFSAKSRPLRLDLDPAFDIFRTLHPAETPPALSGAFGAAGQLIVLPSQASPELLEGYRGLANMWSKNGEAEVTVVTDDEISELPRDKGIWVLGWENFFFTEATKPLALYPAKFRGDETDLGAATISLKGHSLVTTCRREGGMPITLICADTATSLPGLARKLPHYNKYSYLGFEGTEPSNIAKGRWPAVGSPLSAQFNGNGDSDGDVPRAKLAKRPALATPPALFSSKRMAQFATLLSSPKYRGRGFGSKELTEASLLIADEFALLGLVPGGDDGQWFQRFTASGAINPLTPDALEDVALANVVGVIPGSEPSWAGQSVIVGAHYDGQGMGWPDARRGNAGLLHPAADDNASGVAVMLELARYFSKTKPRRSIVFVAFSSEENQRLGSKHYVEAASDYPAKNAIGMINLDTVGRLGEGKLLVFGAGSAREWVHIFMGAGFVTGAKVESVSKDIGSSDQTSFIDAGIPAVQLFSGAHTDYHSPADTSDKLDSQGLATVAAVAKEAIEYLADRVEYLDSAAGKVAKGASASGSTSRKVSLGTVPDFAWSGVGVKVDEVVPGSAAEAAGIKKGDVITALDGESVHDLKMFSDKLKTHNPGDRVILMILRGTSGFALEALLQAR